MNENSHSRLVFLLDVDNTLIDNDRVKVDLQAQIEQLVGSDRGARFWVFYEDVRREQDYVDFPRTLERFRAAFPDEPGFAQLASMLLCYPYERWLFPETLVPTGIELAGDGHQAQSGLPW